MKFEQNINSLYGSRYQFRWLGLSKFYFKKSVRNKFEKKNTIEVEVGTIQNMATSNLMRHIVIILKDPSSCLNPILFYFTFLALCVFLRLSFFSLLFASLLYIVLVFLFFVICFHFVCCVGVCCASLHHCVHVIYNFIPLYINLVIKSLNIVIQAMRTASNIQ